MGLSSQGEHAAVVTTVVQRGAQQAYRKPIGALTGGPAAAAKCEMLKLYLTVADETHCLIKCL